MSFNFQEALTKGAEQAKQKKINSKIIKDIFKKFSADIGEFIGTELETKILVEFEKERPLDPFEGSMGLAKLNRLSLKERPKPTGYYSWLLKNPTKETIVELFSYKEGREGFPVQIKEDNNTIICDSEGEIVEFLADLASESTFHFKLNRISNKEEA